MTLPALRPSIGAGALLVALYVLSDFGVVSLMHYDALTRAIYLAVPDALRPHAAAVLALVLVALTAIVLVLEGALAAGAYHRRRRARRPARPQRSVAGAGRRSPSARGRRRSLALPVAVLVTGSGADRLGTPTSPGARR